MGHCMGSLRRKRGPRTQEDSGPKAMPTDEKWVRTDDGDRRGIRVPAGPRGGGWARGSVEWTSGSAFCRWLLSAGSETSTYPPSEKCSMKFSRADPSGCPPDCFVHSALKRLIPPGHDIRRPGSGDNLQGPSGSAANDSIGIGTQFRVVRKLHIAHPAPGLKFRREQPRSTSDTQRGVERQPGKVGFQPRAGGADREQFGVGGGSWR